MNDKTIAVGLTAFLLLIVAMITRNGDIAWMGLPFWAYLLVGILQAPNLERLSCSAKRVLEQARIHGVPSITVKLAIQNKSSEPVHLLIEETVQPGMEITEGALSQRVTLYPGESTELTYAFTSTRGNFSWRGIRTKVSDPLGVIETEMLLPDTIDNDPCGEWIVGSCQPLSQFEPAAALRFRRQRTSAEHAK